MEELQQCRDVLSIDVLLLHRLRHEASARPVLSATTEDKLQMAMGRLPREKAFTHSCQADYIRQLPVAPGGYKWALTEIDTYFGLAFAYPMVDHKCSEHYKKTWNRRYSTDLDY